MTGLELQQQRHQLQQALLAQREVLEQALAKVYTPSPVPRSRTMRFLQRNTALASLLGRSLRFFIATRLMR